MCVCVCVCVCVCECVCVYMHLSSQCLQQRALSERFVAYTTDEVVVQDPV